MIPTTARLNHQRGALSLLWCVVFFTVLTLSAMAALFSMRYETNYFAYAWSKLMKTLAVQEVQKLSVKHAESAKESLNASLKGEQSANTIRKCIVDGKVMYSNVECKGSDATSRELQSPAPSAVPAKKTVSSLSQ